MTERTGEFFKGGLDLHCSRLGFLSSKLLEFVVLLVDALVCHCLADSVAVGVLSVGEFAVI